MHLLNEQTTRKYIPIIHNYIFLETSIISINRFWNRHILRAQAVQEGPDVLTTISFLSDIRTHYSNCEQF